MLSGTFLVTTKVLLMVLVHAIWEYFMSSILHIAGGSFGTKPLGLFCLTYNESMYGKGFKNI